MKETNSIESVKEEIYNSVENYLDNILSKTKKDKGCISMDEIEKNLEELNIKFNKKSLDLTALILENLDERELIQLKKRIS